MCAFKFFPLPNSMNTYSIVTSESVGYGTDDEKVHVNYSLSFHVLTMFLYMCMFFLDRGLLFPRHS